MQSLRRLNSQFLLLKCSPTPSVPKYSISRLVENGTSIFRQKSDDAAALNPAEPKAAPESLSLPVAQPKTSKAMLAYIKRSQEHDEFMKIQSHDYKVGKRHLANMMGADPETFTQKDIDEAIAYLFPSGLYDKRARPLMKSPEEVFPQRKAAEFDETGRPHHSMFYTGKANFFKLLHDIAQKIIEMNQLEDLMISKNVTADPALTLDLSGSQWLTKDELEIILMETIEDIEYGNFTTAMDRLLSLPYSYKSVEFIQKYRKPLITQTNMYNILEPQYDKDGRQYITVYECLRKRARADVTLRSPGTGKITINGQDITYFEHSQPREQVSHLF